MLLGAVKLADDIADPYNLYLKDVCFHDRSRLLDTIMTCYLIPFATELLPVLQLVFLNLLHV